MVEKVSPIDKGDLLTSTTNPLPALPSISPYRISLQYPLHHISVPWLPHSALTPIQTPIQPSPPSNTPESKLYVRALNDNGESGRAAQ